MKSITSIYVFHVDAPDVSVEEHWRHREEGKWDVELHCAVQSNPDSQVLYLIIKYMFKCKTLINFVYQKALIQTFYTSF